MFASIGLAEPDGTVYAAAVSNPRATVGELAAVCGVPASVAGRALHRLAERNMVSRLPGRPVRYLAAAPDVAIGGLIGEREAELREVRGAVHRLMENHRAASRFTSPEQSVEVVVGRDSVSTRVHQLQQSARTEIRGFDKPPYLSPPGTNLAPERRRLREGIRYRVIYERQAVAWPGRLASDIMLGVAAGERARVRPELPLKMVMADDRLAIVPIADDDRAAGAAAYVIHRSSLLDALSTLFEAEWDRAAPLSPTDGRPVTPPTAPDEQTRQLLLLLASGLTDEGIARSMGWSPRTTQRRIHRLLADLDAATRFQAGRNAQARGWL